MGAILPVEAGLRHKHFYHLRCVVLPVGGSVQVAAGGELARRERGEGRLHKAALVVAFLRPGVGEEQVDGGERAIGDHLFQHFERVVADDAQVLQLFLSDQLQQAADAGTMDFDGDEISVRARFRDLRRRIAHAGADLEHQGGLASEDRRGPQQFILEFDAVDGHQFREGAFLPGGHAPLAEHVTADRAPHAALLREGAILPSVGEEGAAL